MAETFNDHRRSGHGHSDVYLGNGFLFRNLGDHGADLHAVYVASFAMSWGPVTWVLLSEMFPNKIRGKAMAVAVAAQWISNYLISWTFPLMDKNSYLLEKFNHGFAYWIYGLMSVLAMILVWKFVPETKEKTLEEMDQLWGPPELTEKETDKI